MTTVPAVIRMALHQHPADKQRGRKTGETEEEEQTNPQASSSWSWCCIFSAPLIESHSSQETGDWINVWWSLRWSHTCSKKKKKKYRQDNKKILLFVLYLSLDTSSIREFLLFGILGHIFLTRSEDRTPELHCCTCRLIGGPKENSKGRIESSCRPDFGGPWTKIFPRARSVRLLLNVKKIIFFILMEQREK